MKGRVVSNKMTKTATVLVTGIKTHPLYKKSFKRSKKYLAQDDIGVELGDLVEIVQVKPISKRKHWKITKVVGREYEVVEREQLKEAAAEAIEEVMPGGKDELSGKNQELSEEPEKPKNRKGGKSHSSA